MKRFFALLSLVAAPVTAQTSATQPSVPSISASAQGEVKVNPDRANIQISVQTKAPTAAAAAAENATKQRAVIDALRALGLAANQVSTIGYNIMPDQRYEQNREPVIVGYTVTNTVSVELTDLTMVGRVIDTALSRGANMISSLNFYSSNTDAARQQAIGLAIAKARGEAEAAARAAGGSLGGVLEISIGGYFPPPRPVDMQMRVAAASMAETPINPGEQTLTVHVNTRWSFISR